MTPELSRPLAVDQLGRASVEERVTATAAECAAVAARLDIPAVLSLECRFRLTRAGAEILADGELHARLRRICVVSLDEFETESRHRFRVRFVPEEIMAKEIDLDPESDDEIGYAGGRIDLGEAAVEELALSLDPYPRKVGVELELGWDDTASPFAALAPRQS